MVVYKLHRAIGRPVVFKGYKGPYIFLAGLSLIADLLLFVILYLSRVMPWICILTVLALGWTSLTKIAKLNKFYGPYGLQKRMAAKRLPLVIPINSRQVFLNMLKSSNNEKETITSAD